MIINTIFRTVIGAIITAIIAFIIYLTYGLAVTYGWLALIVPAFLLVSWIVGIAFDLLTGDSY